MVTTRANIGVNSQPITIKIGFPSNNKANMAYIVEPLASNKSGPGLNPWAKKAPIRIAAVALPFPNFSGVLDALLAAPYPIKVAIAAPVPGIAPIIVPSIEDLKIVFILPFTSLSFRGLPPFK